MDRKEAETSLKNDWYINNGNLIVEHDKVNRFLEACGMGIKALHEPERKKGQWELIEEDWNVYRCSACGEDWVLETATPQENNMNFCPFCGADMRGEEE